MFFLRSIVFISCLFAASLSYAETKTSLTSPEIGEILRQAGYEVEMKANDETNEPFVNLKSGGFNFTVKARNCLVTSCELLLFFANFNLNRELTFEDYKAINNYNDTELYGRAYVYKDSDTVGIDFILDLRGGVNVDYIRLNAERFPGQIQKFVDHFKNRTSN